MGEQGGSITGVTGRIEWAYYVAATIEGYTVTRSKAGGWSLSATVVQHDAFQLRQRPLLFVATHKKGEWIWPMESCRLVDRTITATLGPPMETRR